MLHRLMISFYMTLALIASASTAYGESLTGDDFLKFCISTDPNSQPKDRDESDEIVRCLGYFEGTVTAMFTLNKVIFCLPGSISPDDILINTVNWLRHNPDQKKYLAASDIIAAAHEKWPCH